MARRKTKKMTTPEPGWYDDPENSNAQRYWDGQNWTPHRQRKNTTPNEPHPAPVAPPLGPQMSPSPPGPAGGPSPWEQVRPYVNKAGADGRRFWSRQPRQRKIIWAVAGAVVAAAAAITIFVTAGPLSTFGGGGSGVDTSSHSYQMGLASGTNGNAEMAAFGYDAISDQPGQVLQKVGPVSHQEACEESWKFDTGVGSEQNLNKTDYMAGCLYGLDHNANSNPSAPRTVTPPTHK
jgi:Protein of unknown function (DUF2510)